MYPREEAEFDPPADKSLECFAARLAALSPHARLDRDRLMFLAGRASIGSLNNQTPRWAWPIAFSAMTALAACLLMLLASRQEPKVVERIVRVPAPVEPDDAAGERRTLAKSLTGRSNVGRPARPPSTSDGLEVRAATYLDLRDRVLALGLDTWPLPSGVSDVRACSPPDNCRDLLKRMLSEG